MQIPPPIPFWQGVSTTQTASSPELLLCGTSSQEGASLTIFILVFFFQIQDHSNMLGEHTHTFNSDVTAKSTVLFIMFTILRVEFEMPVMQS